MAMNNDHFHTHGPDELAMLRAECDKWHKAYDRVWEERMRFADRAVTLEKEVVGLLMKISSLEKLVETADKVIAQKSGFTIKDIKFGGVKLEGINKEARG